MSLSRRLIHVPRHKWAIWQMDRSGLNKLFAARDAKALAPQAFDLWFLYRQIRQRRPQTVVEFGVGNSTLVMAEAMRRNGFGSLHTIDASEHWISDTKRGLTNQCVTMHTSPVESMEIDGERCHRYAKHPDVRLIDLLFLDGPSPKDIPGWAGKPIAADPIMLEERFAPGFRMVVDSRLDNVAFLKRRLRRYYRVRTDRIFGITTFDLMP